MLCLCSGRIKRNSELHEELHSECSSRALCAILSAQAAFGFTGFEFTSNHPKKQILSSTCFI